MFGSTYLCEQMFLSHETKQELQKIMFNRCTCVINKESVMLATRILNLAIS